MDFAIASAPTMNVVFIVDLSGSMAGKLPEMKAALEDAITGLFFNYVGPVRVGIVSFSASHNATQVPRWYSPGDNPKYADVSACLEGPDAETCLPAEPASLFGREDRAELSQIIENLQTHNSDYTAVGFLRAKDILDRAEGTKVAIYLTDGQAKCGDPGSWERDGSGVWSGRGPARDEAAPTCYLSFRDGIAINVPDIERTEKLATEISGGLKGSYDNPNGVRVYSIAYGTSLSAKIRERSSACDITAPFRYVGGIYAPGSGAVSCPADRPTYAFRAGENNIEEVYTAIIESLVSFDVILDRAGDRSPNPVRGPGEGVAIKLPEGFFCDPDAAQDYDFSIITRLPGISIRASNTRFAMCQL